MIALVTGGARSGKSSFAESKYRGLEEVVYIATSKVEDPEMEDRVRLHREGRPGIWRTYEGYRNLKEALGPEDNYLLDCVTVMVSNIMFDHSLDLEKIEPELQREIEADILGELEDLISNIRSRGKNLILVTNEVGSSIVPMYNVSRVFRDIQGRVNQWLGERSDQVYLVVCGIPVKIK